MLHVQLTCGNFISLPNFPLSFLFSLSVPQITSVSTPTLMSVAKVSAVVAMVFVSSGIPVILSGTRSINCALKLPSPSWWLCTHCFILLTNSGSTPITFWALASKSRTSTVFLKKIFTRIIKFAHTINGNIFLL